MVEQSTCVRGKPAEPEPAHSSSADTKPKSIKKPTGWNFFFQSVAVSLFCTSQNIPAFLARIKRLFEQSHMLLFPRFFVSFHSQKSGNNLEESRNRAGFQVVGNMWKKLPKDRRKVGNELRTLRMFISTLLHFMINGFHYKNMWIWKQFSQ